MWEQGYALLENRNLGARFFKIPSQGRACDPSSTNKYVHIEMIAEDSVTLLKRSYEGDEVLQAPPFLLYSLQPGSLSNVMFDFGADAYPDVFGGGEVSGSGLKQLGWARQRFSQSGR